MFSDKTFEEKTTWLYGFVSSIAYITYLIVLLRRARGIALQEVAYIGPLIWTIAGTIAAMILGSILLAAISPGECEKKDVRDREIGRFGDYIGQSFMCIGILSGLILCMVEVAHFWIANALYLSCFAASLLGSTAKIVAYRQGVPKW